MCVCVFIYRRIANISLTNALKSTMKTYMQRRRYPVQTHPLDDDVGMPSYFHQLTCSRVPVPVPVPVLCVCVWNVIFADVNASITPMADLKSMFVFCEMCVANCRNASARSGAQKRQEHRPPNTTVSHEFVLHITVVKSNNHGEPHSVDTQNSIPFSRSIYIVASSRHGFSIQFTGVNYRNTTQHHTPLMCGCASVCIG